MYRPIGVLDSRWHPLLISGEISALKKICLYGLVYQKLELWLLAARESSIVGYVIDVKCWLLSIHFMTGLMGLDNSPVRWFSFAFGAYNTEICVHILKSSFFRSIFVSALVIWFLSQRLLARKSPYFIRVVLHVDFIEFFYTTFALILYLKHANTHNKWLLFPVCNCWALISKTCLVIVLSFLLMVLFFAWRELQSVWGLFTVATKSSVCTIRSSWLFSCCSYWNWVFNKTTTSVFPLAINWLCQTGCSTCWNIHGRHTVSLSRRLPIQKVIMLIA